MKKKLYITRAIKLTAFFLLSALVIGVLQEYVLCHHDANRLRLDAFYIEDKETIDVAMIGSSEMYSGISPALLYEKYADMIVREAGGEIEDVVAEIICRIRENQPRKDPGSEGQPAPEEVQVAAEPFVNDFTENSAVQETAAEAYDTGSDYEENPDIELEPNQFIAARRFSLEEILDQARKRGADPKITKDNVSGVSIVDYSDLIGK